MASYGNFQSKGAKYSKDRYDIYEPSFESPFQQSEKSMNAIQSNIDQWVEFCAFIRWMPDIFWDMYKPETGGLTFDLYQRVMIRQLARFPENYFLYTERWSQNTFTCNGKISCSYLLSKYYIDDNIFH